MRYFTLMFSQGLLGLVLLVLFSGCASQPERVLLPLEHTRAAPWGALERNEEGIFEAASAQDYDAILARRVVSKREKHPEGKIPIRALAISGGGLRGNYGTGVITGWSESGQRIEFDIVSGVSVGALMAPFVFLGEAFDGQLLKSASEAVEILSSSKARPSLLRSGSPYVGESFDALLEKWLTPELIDAVAVQHRLGRRLFVGSTNLDGRTFTIWDLGMIAASDRPEKVMVFRKAILASASVPLVFPPVLFDVNTPEGTGQQLHVDGGVQHNVFMADYDANWVRVLDQAQMSVEDLRVELYVLHNGYLSAGPPKEAVENSVFPIVGASFGALFNKSVEEGIYTLWLLSMISDSQFNLVHIPNELQIASSVSQVSPADAKYLFTHGQARGKTGNPWHTLEPPEDKSELLWMIGGEPLANAFERKYFQQRRQSWDYLEPDDRLSDMESGEDRTTEAAQCPAP